MTMIDEPVSGGATADLDPAPWWGAPRSTRRWWVLIGFITLAGLALRVFYILYFRGDFIENVLPTGKVYRTQVWGDGLVYSRQANLLADGEGLIAPLPFELDGVRQQSADHPPLYTLYLAFWSVIGVRSDLAHMLVSAPLGALTAAAFGVLGRRIAGPSVGLVAAVIGAFSPSIFPYPGFVLAETITIPMAALAIWAAYRTYDNPTIKNAAWLGALTGIASMARAELAMLVFFMIIPLLIVTLRTTTWKHRISMLVAAGITCASIALPWVGYNLSRFEEPIYMSIGLDYALVQGNCEAAYTDDILGYYWLGCMTEALDEAGLAYADQSVGAKYVRDVGWQYVLDHRGRATQAAFARVGRVSGTFHPMQQARLNSLIAGREPWVANAGVLLWYPMVVLSFFGAVMLRRERRPLYPLLAVLWLTTLAVFISVAVLRYRASLEPMLAVLTAVAVVRAAAFVRRARADA